ncbi:hypothetical protein P170DRAFT_469369 [Aspergillus steynii IBT 23096]|uniref:Nucleotidyltransferase n=1 Tax=Aspergillus steynii IBT 23096 TaxID=1392250 RepID=A0A2I2GLY4_9EURO|nr:uncharacterized protein P170DRAFT_469369 [Aspergillus steynii IBT 23096]PLB53885.1 hypothetical protein P170DRAFT_469369 [Aspergillus steynii IBT 23096]
MAPLAALRATASEFVHILQQTAGLRKIPGFDAIQLVVIGGFAVYSHTRHRETGDLDFAIDPPTLGRPLKNALVAEYPSIFSFNAERFVMARTSAPIQIDLVPATLLPQRSVSLTPLMAINPQIVPHLGPIDLILSKSVCCGTRSTDNANFQDTDDVWRLIKMFLIHRNGVLTASQIRIMRDADIYLVTSAGQYRWINVLP